ncbi:cytochrome P450 [Hoeflea marina]|uniref:Cytochrome P450 n=1 Tax=Hoeflea marina TaxID=274592 RepID=A0A317PD35_9HYPH|nr:cytochrome P450 [Hoeflea marina]PWV97092.1 cytochrome P450 [Hoeflea marina]
MRNKVIYINDFHEGCLVLDNPVFRADYPVRLSRQILGATALDTERPYHLESKRIWRSAFSRTNVERKYREIIETSMVEGFRLAEERNDLLLTTSFIPNRILLRLMNLPDTDPLVHHQNIKAIVTYFEDGIHTEASKAAFAYAHDPKFERACDIFRELPSAKDRINELSLLLIGAVETTGIAMKILCGVWHSRHQELERLIADHGMDGAILRILIDDVPLGLATRHCSKDMKLADIEISRGDIVHVDIMKSHRNENARGESSRLTADNHLVWGRGRHRCPGSNLAKAELKLYLEKLMTFVPGDFTMESAEGVQRPVTFRHTTCTSISRCPVHREKISS